jgi:sporulation protein YlmC with PRC-barrel domain
MIDIPVYATVECADGHGGQTTHVVIDPATRQATHFVVQEWRPLRTERLVSVDEVAEIKGDKIHLRCTKEELATMDLFVETEYIRVERPHYEDYPYLMGRYVPVTTEWMPVKQERIPPGEVVVRQGAQVEATDGYVGRVGEILVDAETGEITHLVLREGHLRGQKEVTIPVSAIDRALEDTIYLKLDRATIGSMIAVPVRRREGFDEWFAMLHAEREASRKKLQGQMEASFQEWDAEIQRLEARVAQAGAEAKAELDEQIDALRVKQEAAQATLHEKMVAQLRAWQANLGYLSAGTDTRAEAKAELVRQLDLLSDKWQAMWARWEQDMEADIAAMDAWTEMIATGMAKMAAEEQAESERRAEEARARQEQAQAKLQDLRKSSAAARKDLGEGVDEAKAD